jgi:hypothetical protein
MMGEFKILIICIAYYNGSSLHSNVLSFEDRKAAEAAYDTIENCINLGKGYIKEAVRLYV